MKKFLLLNYGFEQPTPEIMGKWNQWFSSISDNILDQGGHCSTGKEISHAGTKDLPLDKDAFTGYLIIQANDMNEAEEIAKACPFIKSIQVFELMSMKPE